MAHFFPPTGAARTEYQIDGRLAPDSVSFLRVLKGERKPIGLWGGRGLWIRLTIPGVVGDPISVRQANVDVQVLTLEGKNLGSTVVQTGLGSVPSVSLKVEVIASSADNAADRILARPYDPVVLDQASKEFSQGFVDGVAQKLDAKLAAEIATKISADEKGFYKGYALGVLIGLWEGFKSFVEAIAGLANIVMMATPQGLMREAVLMLTSDTHRRMREQQAEDVAKGLKTLQDMAVAATDAMTEIAVNAHLYVPHSRFVGIIVGSEIADIVASEARSKSAEELGKFIGKILGLVLFEIIAQILFAVFTGGAGNAAKGGAAVAKGGAVIADGTGLVARLVARLERVIDAVPALRKLILGMRGEQAVARGAAALLEAELELAFGEAAVLQRGARGGFPILEKLPELSAEARTATSKLLGQEFSPTLQSTWKACQNPQAVTELTEVQRLLKTGSAADREAAYALSERTYGNWRDRFWTKVRGDPSLKKIFTDAGASFEGKSGAPFYKLDGGGRTKNLTVTLDHFIERRVDNPGRAVDALNVRPSLSFENSATLEAIRKDNFIKGWKSPIDP